MISIDLAAPNFEGKAIAAIIVPMVGNDDQSTRLTSGFVEERSPAYAMSTVFLNKTIYGSLEKNDSLDNEFSIGASHSYDG